MYLWSKVKPYSSGGYPSTRTSLSTVCSYASCSNDSGLYCASV
jgi:hypothetical protein